MAEHQAVNGSEPLLSKRRLGWAGLAALVGCAACCTLPLLGLLGLGSGAAAALSRVLRPGSELIVGGTAFAVALAFMAARSRLRVKKVRLAAAGLSAPFTGCGCEPTPTPAQSARVFHSRPPPADEPIACTMSLSNKAAVQAHIDAYRAAFTWCTGGERFSGGFRWRFRAAPGLAEELKSIAERERACCRFLSFDLRLNGDELTWETRGDDRAARFLDEFFLLPERLRAEPRTGHDVQAVKRAAEQAGLVFAADGFERAGS